MKLPGYKQIFLFALYILFLAGLLEASLRLVFPMPEIGNFNRMNYSEIIHSPLSSSGYLANASFKWSSEPDNAEFVHNLNLYGFRDSDWTVEHKKGKERIVFIGDSFVEGFMAGDDETIPQGFRQEAGKNNDTFEVLNLGIGASDIKNYFSLIADSTPLFQPERLFLIFYANDFPKTGQFSPSWLNPTFAPEYADVFVPRLYSIIQRIHDNAPVARLWNSRPFPFIAATPDPRNPWSDKMAEERYMSIVEPAIAKAMKQGQFNPYSVNSYTLYKIKLQMPFAAGNHLRALKSFTRQHSVRLYIVYIPANHQVSDAYLQYHKQFDADKNPQSLQGKQYQIHARILGAVCKQLKIPFLDLTPLFREREANGERLYWNYDEHMKGKSYLLAGKYIYTWFKRLPDHKKT